MQTRIMSVFEFFFNTYYLYFTELLYPMSDSVQSVKKHNWCTLATAHKKFQHTLARTEKSVKHRVWPGRNKTYFYHTIHRETQNSPAKLFTTSAGLPAKRCPLRFFTPRPNTARKFLSCLSDKGYLMTLGKLRERGARPCFVWRFSGHGFL